MKKGIFDFSDAGYVPEKLWGHYPWIIIGVHKSKNNYPAWFSTSQPAFFLITGCLFAE